MSYFHRSIFCSVAEGIVECSSLKPYFAAVRILLLQRDDMDSPLETIRAATIEATTRCGAALVLLFILSSCVNEGSHIGHAAETVQNGVVRDPGGKKLAILIGVKNYNRLNDLRWCDNDVKLVAKTLRAHCQFQDIVEMTEDAERILQPTRGNIMAVLQERLQAANAASYSQVIVFFAGHGLRDDAGKLYLAPQDFAFGVLKQTGVHVEFIRDALNACVDIPVKLLVLDTCHAGETRGPLRTLSGSTLAAPFRTAHGLLTLASCRPNEESLEWNLVGHGLFTYWLCEGLRGEADNVPIGNGDGVVDTHELSVFVDKKVRQTSQSLQRDQRPVAIPSQQWKAPAAFATVAPGLAGVPRHESQVAYHVIQSQKYRNGGNYKAAIDELEGAFKAAPNNSNLFAMRASIRLERGLRNSERFRLHAAVEDLNRTFSHVNADLTDQDIAAFYSIQSKVRFHLKQLDEALNDANQVIRLHASSAQAFRNRAKIYGAMGRQQDAVRDLKEAHRLHSGKTKLNQPAPAAKVEAASNKRPPANPPTVERSEQKDGGR